MALLIKAVKLAAEKYNKSLLAHDKRFQRSVIIIHRDGSVMNYVSAFLMSVQESQQEYENSKLNEFGTKREYKKYTFTKRWVIVFTEHHGMHIYHSDDLIKYFELKRIKNKIEELAI